MVVFPMFKNFLVQSFKGEYKVEFTEYLDALKSNLKEGDVVILDSNIQKLYPKICELLDDYYIEVIEASEKAKTYEKIGELINRVIGFGFSKNNRLVGIGGGVVQDITAFSASIMFRGVEWLFFPTNLLTQCDSCIGSKTSVNIGDYKNQLGGFHPPRHIFIDFSFIDTLSNLEICSGLGEMMHYFLLQKDTNLEDLGIEIVAAQSDKLVLAKLIERSLGIKKLMIEIDEFDTGPRNIFNYGHSFGHAIEACTNFEVPHGVAVAYGIDLANSISVQLGLVDKEFRNKVRKILACIWKSKALPAVDISDYFTALSKDKKNVGKQIKVILTEGMGDMYKTTLPVNDDIKALISSFFNNKTYERDL
ncbi:MAG: 3-dehydroquinate synthase [Ponticaulis sp.]|nr:3-dehydroquinate synthase [Ponticaulis sp.]